MSTRKTEPVRARSSSQRIRRVRKSAPIESSDFCEMANRSKANRTTVGIRSKCVTTRCSPRPKATRWLCPKWMLPLRAVILPHLQIKVNRAFYAHCLSKLQRPMHRFRQFRPRHCVCQAAVGDWARCPRPWSSLGVPTCRSRENCRHPWRSGICLLRRRKAYFRHPQQCFPLLHPRNLHHR